MDIEYFARLWSERTVSRTPSKSFWDNRAAEFNKPVSQHGPDERTRKIVGFLSQNNLLIQDRSVLDIGCGPGRFAVEFAKRAMDVTGLDISDKMLDYQRSLQMDLSKRTSRPKPPGFIGRLKLEGTFLPVKA